MTDFVSTQPRADKANWRSGSAGLAGLSVTTVALLGAPALAHADVVPFTPPEGVTAYRLMFVTADPITAASNDISTYNSFVATEAANNPDLPATTWSALVSTPTVDAVTNISCGASCDANDPIYLVDGTTLVATSAAAMFQGVFSNAPDEDQFGDANVAYVWTGSYSDGTADTGFEAGSAAGETEIGFSPIYTSAAITGSIAPDTISDRLYAVSAEIDVPEPASSGAVLAGAIVTAGLLRRRLAGGARVG
jgi:hypothetical protein